MRNRTHALIAAALAAASIASVTNVATAAPAAAFAIAKAAPSDVEAVARRLGLGRRRRLPRRRDRGERVGRTSLLLCLSAGLLCAPYYPAPVYGAPPPGYAAPDGDAVAYCARKYRSYDPASGTFLGNDGARHPCP